MVDIDNMDKANNDLKPKLSSELSGYEQSVTFAQYMAKSTLLPPHLQGKVGNCLTVLRIAMTLKMDPVLVALKTSVIPKRGGGEALMFEGQLVHAVINTSGILDGRLKFKFEGQNAQTKCTVYGTIKGDSEPSIVTVEMPKTQNSPLWSGNQFEKEQQLSYLAARMWCRRFAPEVLLGVYTRDEIMESKNLLQEPDFSSLDDSHEPAQLENLSKNDIHVPIMADKQPEPITLSLEDDEPAPKAEKAICAKCNGSGCAPYKDVDENGEDIEGLGPCDCQTTAKGE